MNSHQIKAQLVNIAEERIYPAEIHIAGGKIIAIQELAPGSLTDGAPFILPGFIDSHVHIESSMLVPSEFARLAVVHGTVSTVSDPHEIANVCGMQGVEYMINNGNTVPFKFNFGAPSCVPATSFESAGAVLDAKDVEALLKRDDIKYLSEMMNFPGVLFKDPEVMEKIAAAHRFGKPVDGHAPGLRGAEIRQYIDAGISTDHECFTREEAEEKLKLGMKVLIREGSAARNFEALIDLMNDYPDLMMFCSDDKHPDSLVEGHIDQLCARAIAKGIGLFKVLKAACVNPVQHYKLDVGLLREGDPADFILAENLINFKVLSTYINGQLVADNGKSLIDRVPVKPINHFHAEPKRISYFQKPYRGEATIPVIEALDGQLITNRLDLEPAVRDGLLVADQDRDLLKIVVVNRYDHEKPAAIGFIRNFGLKNGAIGSSVAHDSHNIVAVGTDDEAICTGVNAVIATQGGISCVVRFKDSSFHHNTLETHLLPLGVAGLMSADDGYTVAVKYTAMDHLAKSLGTQLSAPYMTLSFMALLVIPHLKLSDLGIFDGDQFRLI
ncbi:adenine deaminase [Pseudoflavitalea sp. G-6-1-2]|uniref:adenine deaminase n=1 Tax=Pseudoflavitalea sp. G-6-1-2 TaxID=2728841 RepID=UPI00146BD02B|nr:adenine deaminase [Pseudoflavitalea sp. G-6-1-2]NML19364.1 adenine deaminase [Pseudoflavitalea sp. G-6-1-2]